MKQSHSRATSSDLEASAHSAWWRGAVSLLLIGHLAAIFVAPWSQPPPASRLSQEAARIVRPYLIAIHQFHGYRFFAPQPGPSHLVRYELILSDGSKVQGRFPDHAQHRPRLLYHRHFMLSEHLNNFFIPHDPTNPPPAEALALFDAYARSYAQHLMHSYGAELVTLELVAHNIPDPEMIIDGMTLDDERSYETLYTGTFTRESM